MTHEEIFTFPPKKLFAGTLNFAVIGLAHPHIYAMCEGLIRAGARFKYVYDENGELLKNFTDKYNQASSCGSREEIYQKSDISLIVSAAIPSERAQIAVEAMNAGKHFFVDKAPLISLEQLELVKKTVQKTQRKYFVYYCESIDEESTVYALSLVKCGIIGKVLHISGSAPHFLNPQSRPDWFFEREKTGGILIDIGSHQVHQFLRFTGSFDAKTDFARVGNISFPQYSGFDESGELLLKANSGATGSFYVNWDSPAGLKSWGDPRMIIQGDKGYIELRKNFDIAHSLTPAQVFVVNNDGVFHQSVAGRVPMNYFEELISDCTQNTSYNDTQLDFKAIEIAITAQNMARR